jgi:hypothetical protein
MNFLLKVWLPRKDQLYLRSLKRKRKEKNIYYQRYIAGWSSW